MRTDRARVVCDVGIAGDEAGIAVVGALRGGEADHLLTAVDDALVEDVVRIDVDLSSCEAVDLDGARALEAVATRCARRGVWCSVRGADRFVRHLVEGLGLRVPLT